MNQTEIPRIVFVRSPAASSDDIDILKRAWSLVRSTTMFFLLLYFFSHACSCSEAKANPKEKPSEEEISLYCNDQCLAGIQELCNEYGFEPGSEECSCSLMVCEAACECSILHGRDSCSAQELGPRYCRDLLDSYNEVP